MPDITMCKNKNCTAKDNCYRYIAKPDSYQSYFIGEVGNDNNCEHYWEVGNVAS